MCRSVEISTAAGKTCAGFVSAGGGRWFWKTLENLPVGARIFAHIPGAGYVGVGLVEEPARIVTDVRVAQNGKEVALLDIPPSSSQDARDRKMITS